MANTTNYDYMSNGNNTANVRVIKQYALFLFKASDSSVTLPTSKDWTPPVDAKPVGYSTEDGAVLHPEPGDETEIKGHNGDVIYSEASGGYWTLQLAGVECKKDIASAYFGVAAATDGSLKLDSAATAGEYNVVLAALDQHGDPLVVVLRNASVSDRDDVTLTYTDAVQLNLTFKGKKPAGGHMLEVYGLVKDAA